MWWTWKLCAFAKETAQTSQQLVKGEFWPNPKLWTNTQWSWATRMMRKSPISLGALGFGQYTLKWFSSMTFLASGLELILWLLHFLTFIKWINRYRDSYPLVMRKRGYICLYWPQMAKIAVIWLSRASNAHNRCKLNLKDVVLCVGHLQYEYSTSHLGSKTFDRVGRGRSISAREMDLFISVTVAQMIKVRK